MKPAKCAAFACDHNCSGKCFYLARPSRPVQLAISPPVGADLKALLHTVRAMSEVDPFNEAQVMSALVALQDEWARIPREYLIAVGLT